MIEVPTPPSSSSPPALSFTTTLSLSIYCAPVATTIIYIMSHLVPAMLSYESESCFHC